MVGAVDREAAPATAEQDLDHPRMNMQLRIVPHLRVVRLAERREIRKAVGRQIDDRRLADVRILRRRLFDPGGKGASAGARRVDRFPFHVRDSDVAF